MTAKVCPPLVPNDQLIALASIVHAIISGQIPPPELTARLLQESGPVYGELREAGRLVVSRWETRQNSWESLCSLLQSLRGVHGNDLLLCFCLEEKALRDEATWKQATANIKRGLSAYEIGPSNLPQSVHVSPFAMIAQNRPIGNFLPHPTSELPTIADSRATRLSIRAFNTEQYHIDLRTNGPAEHLFRCGRLIPLSGITKPFVEHLAQLLSNFLVQSVQSDGRMTYLYYPSRGTEDQSKNNSIRQWMAALALCRIWQRSAAPELPSMIGRNIDFNLKEMYCEEGGLGLITDGTKVKLGAVALAALALRESPFAENYQTIYQRLLATVDFLWSDSGEFRTFYRPTDRMDCQNFYPGEALLLWATIIGERGERSRLERFWKSFEFYQRWHLANRNPAFIPWHTQAYYKVWKLNRDARLAEAIFMMNDWLLDVQQWETAPCPDSQGRFYDPKRPFGPPHASSTGVYLEGFADAFALAREVNDSVRADSYRTAILRGLRSISQLTFKDDLDMFYVSKRNRLRGGVRTTEYNNTVRIDNVQHPLMAIQKVLNVFSNEDFT